MTRLDSVHDLVQTLEILMDANRRRLLQALLRGVTAIFLTASSMAVTATAAPIDPDQPIDLELKSAPLIETLQSFAGISGSRLDIGPGVEGRVTLALENTPWRDVLNRICVDHALNCELLSGEPPVLRVRSTSGAEGAAGQAGYARAIDMSLKAADLRQTLQAFGMIGGIDVVVDQAVTGKLTIEVKDTPWNVVLEESCNLSGCRVEWDTEAVHILPADPAMLDRRRSTIAFDPSPAHRALAALAQTPFFGAMGQPELELEAGLDQVISLDLGKVSWLEALNAVCRVAACDWQLTYGAPSRLTVRPKQQGLDEPVQLPTDTMTLDQAARALASRLDLEIDLDPGLDPRAEVRFLAGERTWKATVQDLCQQASCFWTIHEGRLVLNPRVRALSERPTAGAEDRHVHVRFFPPDTSDPIAGTARFNWASPLNTFGSVPSARSRRDGDDARWLVRLSWIPFGPGLELVVPTIIRCHARGSESEALEPVRWPLSEPVTRTWHDAIVELSSTPASGASARVSGRRFDCSAGAGSPKHSPGKIQAVFRQANVDVDAHETVLDIPSRAGTYLLVTPPGTGDRPGPAVAVLALGTDARGRHRVAMIRPDVTTSGFSMESHTLPTHGEIHQSIAAPQGDVFDLRLRSIE